MKSKSLVSIDQCSKEDILRILDNARKFEENPNRKLLEGKVAATLFFEPSTRTRLSFETAVNRLGGRVIGFSDASTTSSSKGRDLERYDLDGQQLRGLDHYETSSGRRRPLCF